MGESLNDDAEVGDATSASAIMAATRSWSGEGPDSVWFSPGRANLIGEHTDHAGGFVLPFAIQLGVTVAIRTTSARTVRCRSLHFDDSVEFPIADLVDRSRPWSGGWTRYVAGAVAAVAEHARLDAQDLPGLDILVGADLPAGAGLSSSAALECSAIAAVAATLGTAFEPAEIAAAARRVEHEFVGVPCGPMDQLASVFGEADHALLIDCRDLTIEAVPVRFDDAGLAAVVIDTRVHHDLSDGGYERRHAECDRAADLLGVASLREADQATVDEARALDDVTRRRARHVTTENARVLQAAAALRAGDIAALGPLLDASHASLRYDFEVSCTELDVAVEAARQAGAIGARMIGGGFGGSVLALVPVDAIDTMVAAVAAEFGRRDWAEPAGWTVVPSEGLRRLDG